MQSQSIQILKALTIGTPKEKQKALKRLKAPVCGIEVKRGWVLPSLNIRGYYSNSPGPNLIPKSDFLASGGIISMRWADKK
jgi:hypothetical protein